jgi:hydrogenase maturation protease
MTTHALLREVTPLPILVIGYGNALRGDDAVGAQMAEAVAAWALPHVTTLALPQLVPEVAALLAEVQWAIFLDAGATQAGMPFALEAIAPQPDRGFDGHALEPGALLSLTQAIYRRCPEAWLMTIPYDDLRFGVPLSAQTMAGMLAALGFLREQLLGG